MGNALFLIVSGFAALALVIHVTTVLLVLPRFRPTSGPRLQNGHPDLSVLRPVCGLEPGLEQTLASSFGTLSRGDELIFCVASASDPAIPLIRRLIAENPESQASLLIGDDKISGNPKLNNLAKGWVAARHDWIVMIDSNVLLPPAYVQTLFSCWTAGTGLVTSPPAGVRPTGIWASVEAGFLNTYQDRWQLAADQLGFGFAQGKVLMWERALLDGAGGLAALGKDLAEDVASTKVVRAAGLKVRVLKEPFPQPLGRRSPREVWLRQLRWARVRRAGFPALYMAEMFSAAALPFAVVAGLAFTGTLPPAAAIAYPVLWYGAEWSLARRAGWPSSLGQLAAWILRDALIPVIWLAAFASRGFVWRGNAMRSDDPPLRPAE
jgi:ceramide glucosyltransferase